MKKTAQIVLIIVFTLWALSPLHASELEDQAAIDNAIKNIRTEHNQEMVALEARATQGSVQAQFDLARRYEIIELDYVNARRWFEIAAGKGHSESMYYLGRLYEYGKLGHKKAAEALTWYSKAALLGNPKAQFQLAGMYLEGIGTTRDYIEAYVWYSISAASGFMSNLCHGIMDEIEGRLTLAQIGEAQSIAKQRFNEMLQ